MVRRVYSRYNVYEYYLDTDTDGEVRIVYILHLDQKTGEYTLSLWRLFRFGRRDS